MLMPQCPVSRSSPGVTTSGKLHVRRPARKREEVGRTRNDPVTGAREARFVLSTLKRAHRPADEEVTLPRYQQGVPHAQGLLVDSETPIAGVSCHGMAPRALPGPVGGRCSPGEPRSPEGAIVRGDRRRGVASGR